MTAERRAKLVLLAVMFLFALPVLVASGLYAFAPQWRPWGTSNRGNLIPPRDVTPYALEPIDGAETLEGLRGQWILVMLGNTCDEPCQESVHMLGQISRSVGREAHRVTRLFVAPADTSTLPLAGLTRRNPGLRVASAPSDWFPRFSVDGSRPLEAGRIYIVDPHGYLMMEYAEDAEGADIRKDLQRLLKASKGG